jgi:hypothetical protein
MTALKEAVIKAVSWFPVTEVGVWVFLLVMFVISWRLTRRIFKEKDQTTRVFRALISLLVFFALSLFRDSFAYFIRHGPMDLFINKAELTARLQKNTRLWVSPEAFEILWDPSKVDPQKLQGLSPEERRRLEADQTTPSIMTESAMRGIVWMAVEYRHPFSFGHHAFSHTEKGTKDLNRITVEETKAMFDYIVLTDPRSELDARPYLKDALAFSAEEVFAEDQMSSASGGKGIAPGSGHPGKTGGTSYPFIQGSRISPRGRVFLVRISATETRVIRADTEAEALKLAPRR